MTLLTVADTTRAESYMLTCPSKKFFLIDCPGCGLQRSLWALAQGDFTAMWQLYPPTPFLLLTIIFLALHLIIGFRQGAHILKILFIITVLVMTVNYIYKIINHQLI